MRRSSKRNHPNIAPSTSPPFFGYPKDVRIGNRCRICRLTITLKATLSPPRLDSREGAIPQGLFSEYLGGPARRVSSMRASIGYVSSLQIVSPYACACSPYPNTERREIQRSRIPRVNPKFAKCEEYGVP